MWGEWFSARARRQAHLLQQRRLAADPVDTGRLDGFDRIGVLRAQYASQDPAAHSARLWRAVFQKHPELILDLVRIGGLFTQGERFFENGVERKLPLDPYRLAEDKGRREAVLDILAHNLSIDELNNLMEASDEY